MKNQFLFLLFLLTLSTVTLASQTSLCLRSSEDLKRTLSVEWEFGSIGSLVSQWSDPNQQELARAEKVKTLLAESSFRKLFAFYGLDEQGRYVENYLPVTLIQTEKFKQLLEVRELKFEQRGSGLSMQGWESLSADKLNLVMKVLFEARGKYKKTLLLKKVPRAWNNFRTLYDKMIPETVAEEWRKESFVGIEFPIVGYTLEPSELFMYLENLWSRLDLYNIGDPKLTAVGHVHWVADIQSLPLQKREKVYRAILGFWGDANDSFRILFKSNRMRGRLENGRLSLSKLDAIYIFRDLSTAYENPSITALDQKTYKRLSVSAEGLLVKGRQGDLDIRVDSNIPPVFKRLPFGLRGIYGQESLLEGVPIPKVGIEIRGVRSVRESLLASPPVKKGTHLVDVESLLKHSSHLERGLLGSLKQIMSRAEVLGLDTDLVKDLWQLIRTEMNSEWRAELVLSDMLLPLTNWMLHPLVQRNMTLLTEGEQAKAGITYHQALERYIKRLNKLSMARKNSKINYQPDWIDGLPSFADGYNRVFNRSVYPSAAFGTVKNTPNLWFEIILQAEQVRFIIESGLVDLMRMPRD